MGCNFFEWYENNVSDEVKPGIHAPVILKCSKCDEKDVEINMLRRNIDNDGRYTKEVMKIMLKMLKMLGYVVVLLVLILVVLCVFLFWFM